MSNGVEGLIMTSKAENTTILTANTPTSLYEQDYHLWLEQTLTQLRLGKFTHLDLEHLIEEMEDLGKSEKRSISSYLMRVCEHLLKIKYWESERDRCFRGWDTEVTNFRIQIQRSLQNSPSLKNYLSEHFELEYRNGRTLFLKVSGLDASLIPEQPCFSLEQALDEGWLPWQPIFENR